MSMLMLRAVASRSHAAATCCHSNCWKLLCNQAMMGLCSPPFFAIPPPWDGSDWGLKVQLYVAPSPALDAMPCSLFSFQSLSLYALIYCSQFMGHIRMTRSTVTVSSRHAFHFGVVALSKPTLCSSVPTAALSIFPVRVEQRHPACNSFILYPLPCNRLLYSSTCAEQPVRCAMQAGVWGHSSD